MNWINVKDEKPPLNEPIILAYNYNFSDRWKFWKDKVFGFGMLTKVVQTVDGTTYLFKDFRYKSSISSELGGKVGWEGGITHWMPMIQPPSH
jgi:hypothetical protein